MFCRYCGAGIASDSLFCPKCGKRLGGSGNPKIEKIIGRLYLKTPYPYFAVMLLGYILWSAWPRPVPAAYNPNVVKWTIEQDKVLDLPDENLYQQSFSLVLENKGSTPVKQIPIDLLVRLEPQKTAEVTIGFLGRKLTIMTAGQSQPLGIDLQDPIDPGTKRRYLLEGAITAKPSFKATYEVRQRDKPDVLASYVVEK